MNICALDIIKQWTCLFGRDVKVKQLDCAEPLRGLQEGDGCPHSAQVEFGGNQWAGLRFVVWRLAEVRLCARACVCGHGHNEGTKKATNKDQKWRKARWSMQEGGQGNRWPVTSDLHRTQGVSVWGRLEYGQIGRWMEKGGVVSG